VRAPSEFVGIKNKNKKTLFCVRRKGGKFARTPGEFVGAPGLGMPSVDVRLPPACGGAFVE
jgi:hypothetical protein